MKHTELGIVPRPRQVTRPAGKGYRVDETSAIGCDAQAQPIAGYLAERIQRSTGIALTVREPEPARPGISLAVGSVPEMTSLQGYRLVSSADGIRIIGNSPAGLFYGVQTFLQLCPPQVYGVAGTTSAPADWKIPAVEIVDEPYFDNIRGLHIDVSRHFLDKHEVFQVIDILAMHKLNTLHIHLTDNQGWRLEIRAFPRLTEVGAIGCHSAMNEGPARYFTQQDLREIIAYAGSRYIRVMPEIDMPGHMAAAIRSYPDLQCLNDRREMPCVIRIDEPGADFCRRVLTEVRDVFGEVPIHVGFDEVNFGQDQPIYTDEEIWAFARAMTGFIKNDLGVTPVFWDDALERGLNDPDVLMQWWRSGRRYWWKNRALTFDQELQLKDQPYILSPSDWLYFDMKNTNDADGTEWSGTIAVDKIYRWEPLLDLVAADPAKRALAQGVIACTWSEQIRDFDAWQDRVFPRIAALAEKGWAQPADIDTSKPSWETWRDEVLIKNQIPRYEAMDVNYWSRNRPEELSQLGSDRA